MDHLRFRVLWILIWCARLGQTTETIGVSVIELTIGNFTDVLSSTSIRDEYSLIEFYAHWCPHCIHYKPIFERVGRFFNGDPRPEPHIWVSRVDCAVRLNTPLCDIYKIAGYPTLLLGRTDLFLEKKVDDLIKLTPKEPTNVIESINQELKTDYEYEEKLTLMQIPYIAVKTGEIAKHCDLNDMERATVEVFEHIFESAAVLQQNGARDALLDWLQLLSIAHPSTRCRKSCLYLFDNIDFFWPFSAEEPGPFLRRFKMCTVRYVKEDWKSCAGSVPDSRGFTCGLWQIMHALTVGIKEREVQIWLSGIRAFQKYFFGCSECAKHFLEAMDNEKASSIRSRGELILWLWSVHNIVNRRLENEENESGTGDPAYPKTQWPPEEICSECQREQVVSDRVEWKEATVQDFLIQFYSIRLDDFEMQSSRKELISEFQDLTAADVFVKEDVVAIEMKSATSMHFMIYVLIGVVVLGFLMLRTRRRKKEHGRKNIL